MRSPLFLIRVVEISNLPEDSPIDASTITDLVQVRPNAINLFALELAPIERRLLDHPWIHGVTISKRFPGTLSVNIELREPKAIVQRHGGELAYLDQYGSVFVKVDPAHVRDLPMISNVPLDIRKAGPYLARSLQLILLWERSDVSKTSELSSLSYDQERGFRAVISYPLSRQGAKGRALVDLGQEIDTETEALLGRLSSVFSYLSERSIPVKQVWADLGKKIVVKIARSS